MRRWSGATCMKWASGRLGLDEEALAAALAEAIEAALGEWEIALRVPVRLIRAGAMG